MSALGGAWGALGAPRRFSGHGFNRAWASDSIAHILLLLISQPFDSVFSYMDSNGDPLGSLRDLGRAWGPWGVLEGFQAIDSIAHWLSIQSRRDCFC